MSPAKLVYLHVWNTENITMHYEDAVLNTCNYNECIILLFGSNSHFLSTLFCLLLISLHVCRCVDRTDLTINPSLTVISNISAHGTSVFEVMFSLNALWCAQSVLSTCRELSHQMCDHKSFHYEIAWVLVALPIWPGLILHFFTYCVCHNICYFNHFCNPLNSD